LLDASSEEVMTEKYELVIHSHDVTSARDVAIFAADLVPGGCPTGVITLLLAAAVLVDNLSRKPGVSEEESRRIMASAIMGARAVGVKDIETSRGLN
jgi:hypothetical protein